MLIGHSLIFFCIFVKLYFSMYFSSLPSVSEIIILAHNLVFLPGDHQLL